MELPVTPIQRMTHRLAEGSKQDVPLKREAQTACHARLSQLGVPIVGRFRRHDRKGTPASAAQSHVMPILSYDCARSRWTPDAPNMSRRLLSRPAGSAQGHEP